MKRVLLTIATVVLSVSTGKANLADLPGSLDDYLPTIVEGTIESGDTIFSFSSIDEFEAADNNWTLKLKGELEHSDDHGTVTLNELEFNPDPLVTGSLLVENPTASTQTYQFYFSQPAYLAAGSSSVRGGVTVTLMDKSSFPFNGSSFTDNGTPVYKAYIDGNEVDSLLDPAFSLATVPLDTTASYSEEFGWDPYGAGVISNIAIQIEFTLSAGDSATVQSRFEVIPEPGTLILASLVSTAFVFIRRRFVA